jgi:hypothetical protein
MRGWGKHGPHPRHWVDEIEQIAGRPISKQDWAATNAALAVKDNTPIKIVEYGTGGNKVGKDDIDLFFV